MFYREDLFIQIFVIRQVCYEQLVSINCVLCFGLIQANLVWAICWACSSNCFRFVFILRLKSVELVIVYLYSITSVKFREFSLIFYWQWAWLSNFKAYYFKQNLNRYSRRYYVYKLFRQRKNRLCKHLPPYVNI